MSSARFGKGRTISALLSHRVSLGGMLAEEWSGRAEDTKTKQKNQSHKLRKRISHGSEPELSGLVDKILNA